MKCEKVCIRFIDSSTFQATNVDRYVTHLRDLFELADPTTISSHGMPMHNILENDHIDL